MDSSTTHRSVPVFQKAHPLWLKDCAEERNLFAGFRTVLPLRVTPHTCSIHIAGHARYRLYVNGAFVGYGPARAARGFARVDQWDITAHLTSEHNVVAIEAIGYNVDGYSLMNQPSFLQAEILTDGEVVAWTDADNGGFEALRLPEKIQRVERYSRQRPFAEVYRLSANHDRWRCEPDLTIPPFPRERQPVRTLLPRGVPYPRFQRIRPVCVHSAGTLQRIDPDSIASRAWHQDRTDSRGFGNDELEQVPSIDLQRMRFETAPDDRPPVPGCGAAAFLGAERWQLLDFGGNATGFIGLAVCVKTEAHVYLSFDEILVNETIDHSRSKQVGAAVFHFEPGTYHVETIEPYVMRYLRLIALDGAVEVQDVYLREYTHPDAYEAHFSASDPDLDDVFEAGRQTFRQNTVDIFMDCPSRERAGWLCDSFFTARVEADLTGRSQVEHCFLENFVLPDAFPELPAGMLPMCYPADTTRFIPNWALWFVLQLEEYRDRTGDTDLMIQAESRIWNLFATLDGYLNPDGLLEKLDGWIFVEWSKANEFVQDVSYPTNMLYAAALSAAARLYDRPDLDERATRMRAVIRDQSFDGSFFVDNAVRKNGHLVRTMNRTETCQYYAFFFGIADFTKDATLWRKVVDGFGPAPVEPNKGPLHEGDVFIGYYLRMELLSRAGLKKQLLREIKSLFIPMARQTGTLWEHKDPRKSCNHGFASHVCHVLIRDILGVRIDRRRKRIRLDLREAPVEWCRAELPLDGGHLHVDWRRDGNTVRWHVRHAPKDYDLQVLTGGDSNAQF